jgi:hypothetical protein
MIEATKTNVDVLDRDMKVALITTPCEISGTTTSSDVLNAASGATASRVEIRKGRATQSHEKRRGARIAAV